MTTAVMKGGVKENRNFLILMAFIAIGWLSIIGYDRIVESRKTPEQKAAETVERQNFAAAEAAARAEKQKARAEYEAYWRPIVTRNWEARAYAFDDCKERGIMIPDKGRYREWITRCMVNKGYKLHGFLADWFTESESSYEVPDAAYAF